MRGNVLVVDDQVRARRILVDELREAGFAVYEANNGASGWDEFQRRWPDVVITDLVMPKADGLDLLSRIRSRSEVPVILFTAYGTAETATAAFKGGADEFLCSPDVEIDELIGLIQSAVDGVLPSSQSLDLEDRFAGSSRLIVRLRDRFAGLAPLRTPVLISGPAGSGRDAAAQALHDLGATSGGDLAKLDRRTPMLAPSSRSSAVYLDGIDEFDGKGQAFWSDRIRELEANAFRDGPRIFASTAEPISVLSHRESFARGPGRTLLRFPIELPALDDIPGDIPAIAEALTQRRCAEIGRSIPLSRAAILFVSGRRWPGNAAQLDQVLERAVSYSRGRQVRKRTIEEIALETEESLDGIRARELSRERIDLIRRLQESGGNITRVAEDLSRSRAAVYRLMSKHGIPLERRRRE